MSIVPGKTNIPRSESGEPVSAGELPADRHTDKTTTVRPSATGRKSPRPARKKSAPKPAKKKAPKPAEQARKAEPSEEEIRLRAYFISERRHRLALPGDASSDWLEAKRQLLSETGPR
jgi:hypothetical protein